MLEPPLHTATRLGMGHRPVAGGRQAPGAAARCPRPGTGPPGPPLPGVRPVTRVPAHAAVREPGDV